MNALQITAHNGSPLRNRLIVAKESNDRIALMFPGRGYTCSMPLLYYATEALVDQGYDVLHVEYCFDPAESPDSGGEAWRDGFRRDVEAAYAAVVAAGGYSSMLLVGKSLGSVALAILLKNHPELAGAACIWLTPLVGVDQVRTIVSRHAGRSLVVAGDSDRHCDPELLAEIESVQTDVVVIEGADHGLEIGGDPPRSIDALRHTTLSIIRFVADGGR